MNVGDLVKMIWVSNTPLPNQCDLGIVLEIFHGEPMFTNTMKVLWQDGQKTIEYNNKSTVELLVKANK